MSGVDGRGASEGIVARGKIRVDARRAVEKLREHLLVDLHLYTLEIARSAVIGGATKIDVEHDADELKITFDGEGLDEGSLTRLLDHVLVEAVTPEARRLRLLATGVNAALGLSPAYVDILTPADEPAKSAQASGKGAQTSGKGRACLRVRWTPELLTPKDGTEPAKAPTCDRVAAPKGMPERGVRIEVRRRIGWNVVKQAIAGGTPPEVALLAAATHEITVPMALGGAPFSRPGRASAIVRAAFSARGAKRAAVEIIEPMVAHPEIELLEQGVCLTRYAWSFGAKFPSEPLDKVALPVRVIVDTDELPTNASRSEIQRDAPLIGLVGQAAPGAFEDALTTLIAAVTGKGEAAPGTEVLTKEKHALEDALGALACVAAKAAKNGGPLPETTKALLDAPLLRDGLGRPLTPAELLARSASRLYIWRGSEPLPQDLEPWTSDVVWLRGRVAERIFDLFDTADAQQIVEQAKVGAARRRALLAHAAAEPEVPELEDEILRQSFDEKDGDFKGLRGEVAIVAESAERPGTVARIFVDGRQLDTVEIDAEAIPLRLEIALSWEGRIRARYSYDGVERDQSLKLAVWRAARVAVLAADRAAQRLAKKPIEPAMRAAFRAAIATLLLSTERLGLKTPMQEIPLSYLRGLHAAAVWPTSEPDRRESVLGLERVMAKYGCVFTAKPEATGSAPDGRPVLAVKDREFAWLTKALGPPSPTAIPYTRWLLNAFELEQREARWPSLLRSALSDERFDEGFVLEIKQPGIRGLIAVGVDPKLVLLHSGKRVAPPPYKPIYGPVVVVADDDSLVPGDVPVSPKTPAIMDALARIERQFFEMVVAAQEDASARRPEAPGGAGPLLRISPAVRAYLLDGARELRRRINEASKPEDTALLDRVRALPLLLLLDESGAPVAASLADVERAHPSPQPIPFLAKQTGFPSLDWRPVLISREDSTFPAFERWAGGRAVSGDASIPARWAQAMLEQRRRGLMARPSLDLDAVGDLAEASARVTCVSWKTHPLPPGVVIAAALPNTAVVASTSGSQPLVIGGLTLEVAVIDLLYDGRKIDRVMLPSLRIPIVARVSVDNEMYLSNWEGLSERGITLVMHHLRIAARALVDELILAASGPGKGESLFSDIRALRLIQAVMVGPPPDSKVADLLRSQDLLWPTVQGELLPFDAMRVTTGAAGPELCVGSNRHIPWLGPARGRADLDAPILYLPETPEGAALKSVLVAMDIRFRSVTEALTKLQARRAAARPAEAPTLAGAPTHPELRMSLAEAKVQAEGELELIEGPATDVRIIGLDGTQVPVTEGLPFPLRAVARVESVDIRPEMTKALTKEISRAAVRRALSLASKLDEMPPFVRSHIRSIICKAISSKSKIGQRHTTAKVFLDIEGAWRSLDEIRLDPGSQVLFTSDPPPYPKRKPADPVLRLTKEEAEALILLGKLKDVTASLRRDRIAEERASATPRKSIRLEPELRAKCVRVIPVNEGRVTGEIGILAPQHQDKRGIDLFVTGRPLCLIDAGPGWGLCAAVNDDSIKPNRWFDGVKSSASAQEIQRVVRDIAAKEMRATLAAPADALAVRWLDGAAVEGDEKAPLILGSIWLPAAWPIDPSVRALRAIDAEPTRQPVIAPGAASIVRRHAPICGDIIVGDGVTWAAVERAIVRETELMIGELDPTPETRDAVAAYQWNMGLLGLRSMRVPPARTAEGGEVGLAEVAGELAGKGCIWITRREGSADGAFPGAQPAFILLDESSPLIHVLKHRAPPGAIRELGAVEAPNPIESAPSEPSIMIAREPARPLYFRDVLGEIPRPSSPSSPGAPAATATPAPPALPWLERLRRRVALLFTSAAPVRPEDPRTHPENALCAALHQALGELGLVGGPVHEITETHRGPAVRYDEENKRILMNRRHQSLRWLKSSEAPSPRVLSFLIAAIVSEINRALTGVTDAEERRVLLQLLRTGLDAPGAGADGAGGRAT